MPTQRIKPKNYTITENNFAVHFDGLNCFPCPLFVNDIAGAKNHIKSGDYFGTLATVLDLIRQSEKNINPENNRLLRNIKNELIYLQDNYKIIKIQQTRNS